MTPANTRTRNQAVKKLRALGNTVRQGGVKQGVRRGYGATDVQWSARGLASKMGLKKGKSIQWQGKKGQYTLRADTSSRVVLRIQKNDRYMDALRNAVNKVVGKVVADPTYQPTTKEQRRLSMAPTDMRAEALAKHGFKLTRDQRGSGNNLKYMLEVKGAERLDVFSRVFGPSVSTYLPGKGHSQYIHNKTVVDPYMEDTEALRTTNRIVYPVMLKVSEAKNLDQLFAGALGWNSTGVQGYTKSKGRPAAWPPRPGSTDKSTGNTCTTTHHRAPIGPYKKGMGWVGQLDKSMSSLFRSGRLQLPRMIGGFGPALGNQYPVDMDKDRGPIFLKWMSTWSGEARVKAIDQLIQNNRSMDKNTYKQLNRLKRWVKSYNESSLKAFPLNLLGRKPLKELMGVKELPNRLGTTDPLGPGFGRQMYSSASERIPVVVRLKE